jgi:gp16 family phage-associated protein
MYSWRAIMKNTSAFTQQAVERVCSAFVERGETVADWARSHGFEPPQVYAVLAGRNKGRFGRGHDIAVALGLKTGRAERELLSEEVRENSGESVATQVPHPAGHEPKKGVASVGDASKTEGRRP